MFLLTLGVLCGLWETVFGRRKWPGGEATYWERARFAWRERPVAIFGAVIVVASAVLQLLGD